MVFTDGACSNNGTVAKAGLGITLGGEHSWSIPVDDARAPQTKPNQRAELGSDLGLE